MFILSEQSESKSQLPFDKLRVLRLTPQWIHLLTVKRIALKAGVYTERAKRVEVWT